MVSEFPGTIKVLGAPYVCTLMSWTSVISDNRNLDNCERRARRFDKIYSYTFCALTKSQMSEKTEFFYTGIMVDILGPTFSVIIVW